MFVAMELLHTVFSLVRIDVYVVASWCDITNQRGTKSMRLLYHNK